MRIGSVCGIISISSQLPQKKETISEKKHAELFVFSKKGTKGERMVKMAAEYLASVHRAGSGKNSKEEESK